MAMNQNGQQQHQQLQQYGNNRMMHNGTGNKRRLQSNLPAPQTPQGMHTVSRSMGSLGGYTVNQNNAIRNNINLSINNTMSVNMPQQSAANMNQFNSNVAGHSMGTAQTVMGTTTLTISANLQSSLNQQQLWSLYQQQIQEQQHQQRVSQQLHPQQQQEQHQLMHQNQQR